MLSFIIGKGKQKEYASQNLQIKELQKKKKLDRKANIQLCQELMCCKKQILLSNNALSIQIQMNTEQNKRIELLEKTIKKLERHILHVEEKRYLDKLIDDSFPF